MAWMPGAVRRPLTRNYTPRRVKKTKLIFHSTASATARSMFSWFSQRQARASSTFHVDDWGVIEQYLDSDYISWANGDANSESITIETQGDGSKPWTPAQLQALIRIAVWAHKAHGIPLRRMRGAFRVEKGLGWHRMGVRGSFPAGLLGGLLQNGGDQAWSSATGKTCPGTLRIQQMPGLISAAVGEVARPKVPTVGNGKTPWPDAALPLRTAHTEASHNAWVALLRDVGYSFDTLGLGLQKWLASVRDGAGKPYYTGLLDGAFGELSVKALQRFLADRGHYSGVIDGDRGALTVQAELSYLNSQRAFYVKPAPAPTPAPPKVPATPTPTPATPIEKEDTMSVENVKQGLSEALIPYFDHSRQVKRELPLPTVLHNLSLSNSFVRTELEVMKGQVAGLVELVGELADDTEGLRGQDLVDAITEAAHAGATGTDPKPVDGSAA